MILGMLYAVDRASRIAVNRRTEGTLCGKVLNQLECCEHDRSLAYAQ